MTNASHAVRVVMPVQVSALIVLLPVLPALRRVVRSAERTQHLLMAATSRLKLPLVAKPRKPPLSASVKPRQLQQLTVPRLSNRSE